MAGISPIPRDATADNERMANIEIWAKQFWVTTQFRDDAGINKDAYFVQSTMPEGYTLVDADVRWIDPKADLLFATPDEQDAIDRGLLMVRVSVRCYKEPD